MGSGFFVLMRYFMRVDGLLVRMNDTRIYHQVRNHDIVHVYVAI